MGERLIGFVEGMSFDDYAAVDAMSGSSLVRMRRSPLYFHYCECSPQEPTDAMKIGTVVHTATLEPPLLGKIAVWGTKPEEKVRRGQVWDEFQRLHPGRTIVTVAERGEIVDTVTAVWASQPARKYLAEEGATEVSMFWVDPGTGVYMKGRVDKLIRTKHTATIVDLKKTRACGPYKFGSQAFSLGYHTKAAIYVSGYQILTGVRPKFKWIAIESKRPNECAVYRATPDVITLGGEEMLALVQRWKECRRPGIGPRSRRRSLIFSCRITPTTPTTSLKSKPKLQWKGNSEDVQVRKFCAHKGPGILA